MTTAKKQGFTLIELLVVIAIIAILSAIGLVALNGAREKARDAQRRSDIAQIRTALSLYYDDNGSTYPATEAHGASAALATDNVADASPDSESNGATLDGADADTTPGALTQDGELTDNYLAQELKGPTAGSAVATHDHYYYLENIAPDEGGAGAGPASATSYIVYTMLEAAGGENYYGINEQGTVWDIIDTVTALPTCNNAATPVCGF